MKPEWHTDESGYKQFGVKVQFEGATPEWMKQKIEEDEKYKERVKRDMHRMMFGE